MPRGGTTMLHEFLSSNREELIRRCRAKVSQRDAPPVTPLELEHGVAPVPRATARGAALRAGKPGAETRWNPRSLGEDGRLGRKQPYLRRARQRAARQGLHGGPG